VSSGPPSLLAFCSLQPTPPHDSHLICKQGVAGSIPATSTNLILLRQWVSGVCAAEGDCSKFVLCSKLCPPKQQLAAETAGAEKKAEEESLRGYQGGLDTFQRAFSACMDSHAYSVK
jgi:hypothetical protein